jgi:hypothetical protein
MLPATLTLAATFSLLAAPPVEVGTQLSYRGTMVPVRDDGNPTAKEFALELVAVATEQGATEQDAIEFVWTLEEQGRGGWIWLDRFGRCAAAADKREAAGVGPSLLYVREDGKSIVPIVPLLFAGPKELSAEAAWEEGRLEYRVAGQTRIGERDCWEVEARSAYGHKRTLFVAQDQPLVVALHETVFIGQGQEHKLKLELQATKPLAPDETAAVLVSAERWQALRSDLAWEPQSRRDELSDDQLRVLKAALPKILQTAAAGPLAAIAGAAERDAAGQRNRAGAVAALRDAALGKSLGKLPASDIQGKPLSAEARAGKVTVLHFWTYRDTPLVEPYGQVAYLDYLLRRRGTDHVAVIGVMVPESSTDDTSPRALAASARKLQSFMNLSYPIVVDDGSLLKALGDPRIGGGRLPLFVVVGPDGKVAEYHAGLYEVKASEGLAELDAIVGKLLAK